MQYSSYAAFRTGVQTMFDGDDISQSDISIAVLDALIAAGEQRIYREVRSSTMEASFSVTISGNYAAFPSDFLELKGAPYLAGFPVVMFAPWEQLQSALQTQTALSNTLGANPAYYSTEGENLIFYPKQADGVVVTGRYYKRFADISGGVLNAFFTRWPDLFLYASLSESAPFLGEMQRLPIWEQKYKDLVQDVNEQERRRITRGSKLQARTG